MRHALKVWTLCALALATAPQLAAGAKRKRTSSTPRTRGDVRAVDTSVLGLTEERELSTTRVLAEHGHYHADVNRRNFNGTVLGYVTPWWVAADSRAEGGCFSTGGVSVTCARPSSLRCDGRPSTYGALTWLVEAPLLPTCTALTRSFARARKSRACE